MTLVDNLLAYFKFDENAGTSLADSVGSHTGTFVGTAGSQWVAGLINYALQFNGSNNLVTMAADPLQGKTAWTIQGWVRITANGARQNWVSNAGYVGGHTTGYGLGFTNASLGIGLNANSVMLRIGTSADNSIWSTAANTIAVNTWYHIVLVHTDGSTPIIYINGSAAALTFSTLNQGSATPTVLWGNEPPGIGDDAQSYDYHNWTVGKIDEVAFWDRALTSTEAATLYNSGAGLQYGVSPFAPISAPTVTTQAVSSITTIAAVGNGTVTADGGDAITERGCCIGTGANPTTAGTHFSTSGTTGAYTVSMTSLAPSTHYHVRAYAINGIGTSYGADVEFDTAALPPFRFENIGGVVYDATETKTIFAERLNEILDRLHALDGGDPT